MSAGGGALSLSDYMQVAVQAAQRAAEIQMEFMGRAKVELKSSFSDLVTEADRLCEKEVRAIIAAAFPDHGFLGEEGGRADAGSSGFRWIVDPIDGTTNYAHGVPLFAVSIGLEDKNGLRLGVIYAPALGEMYTAERGKGAFLNGEPIRVSTADDLEKSLLVTGFPHSSDPCEPGNIGLFKAFTHRTRGVRRLGSAALNLAWVAAGRLDGFWEIGIKPWDVAAGALLVSEAGGKTTVFSGEDYRLTSPEVIASNGRIHGAMMEVINEVGLE